MAFPQTRLRRLRKTGVLRDLVRETELDARRLIYPMFVVHGAQRREPIETMPGVDRLSISHAVDEAGQVAELGIPAVLLFGVPAQARRQQRIPAGRRARPAPSARHHPAENRT